MPTTYTSVSTDIINNTMTVENTVRDSPSCHFAFSMLMLPLILDGTYGHGDIGIYFDCHCNRHSKCHDN